MQDSDEGVDSRRKKENNTKNTFSFDKWLVSDNSCKDTNNNLQSRCRQSQMIVQERTAPKAERKVLKLQIFVKLVNPTQSKSLFGGKCGSHS